MKNIIYLLLLALIINSCKKDNPVKQGLVNAARLEKITVGGQVSSSFEYDSDNKLTKEKRYGFCSTTPSDENIYNYSGSKLVKMKQVSRAHYSSVHDQCDPNKGVEFEMIFSYDQQGRISTVTRANSVTEYVYDLKGYVVKSILKWNTNEAVTAYTYDAKGNVIKMVESNGNSTYYVYDNKVNPYYHIKSGRGALTPFNMSPNNIIKGTGSINFERKFEYNLSGLPVKVLEDNGLAYTYHYH